MKARRLLTLAILGLVLLAGALHAAETLDRQLQRALDAGDVDGALRLVALDGSPAELRFHFASLVSDCASDMTCTVKLGKLDEEARQSVAAQKEQGVEFPVAPAGVVVVDQKSKDGSGSGKMQMPYGVVDGKPMVLGARFTPAKVAELKAKSNDALMDEAMAQGIYDQASGERRTDWKKAAKKLPAGGGEFGAFVVRRAEALQKAAAAGDPDAAAKAGGRWAEIVFGATGEPPPSLAARKLKLRAQSARFLRDVRVLGGYQLGNDALLLVEAVDANGWRARGPMLVSRDGDVYDISADLTIAHPQ